LKEESDPKQPSCKKVCSPEEGHREKRCESQGGDQEMAVMVGSYRIPTKIGTKMCFNEPFMCAKFQLDWFMRL